VSDKTPLERVLDVVVFGPAGLAITFGEEFPKLVDKGRHRVEGQVHTARLVGQFAVQFGRQKVEEWSGSAVSRRFGPPVGADDAGPAGADSDPLESPAAAGPAAGAGVAAPVEAVPATNGYKPGTHLAIPGYDSLSASQVVQRLDGLSAAELEDVRSHELATRRRRTILSRVEQLLAAASPGPA